MRRSTRVAPPAPSEITPQDVYLSRRSLLGSLAGIAAAPAWAASTAMSPDDRTSTSLEFRRNGAMSTVEKPNSYEDITHYNNFYEFGSDKTDPAENSSRFKPRPWSVRIAGEAEVTGNFTLEDILKPHALEERVYRLRCVEAWAMVIPWVGFSLGDLIKRFRPTSRARYVALTTVQRPAEMPGQRLPILDWPYVEGLRIDEAMHPLTMLAVGLYGKVLPNQNGAPLRLVVPWKYGFKSIKSIVEIRFVEKQPATTWNRLAPEEYGFYANVNPDVDHPRWSQRSERLIGTALLAPRRPTLPFNGYATQVASLYRGMNLQRNY
jgi:sulfoxide reductase catalytic subunit YedY